jgi:hypothetical protein
MKIKLSGLEVFRCVDDNNIDKQSDIIINFTQTGVISISFKANFRKGLCKCVNAEYAKAVMNHSSHSGKCQ